MARIKEVVVLKEHKEKGKTVVVKEKPIGQLEELLNKFLGSKVSEIVQVNDAEQLKSSLFGIIYDNIPELFPPITSEDVKLMYPSEIEELVDAFINVNFFGVKRLAVPLMGLIRQLPQLQAKQEISSDLQNT